MKKRSWIRIYLEVLTNFDRGIVLILTKTGFAWATLLALVALVYGEFYHNQRVLKESLSTIITYWPLLTSLFSLGFGFMLNIYPEDIVISLVRVISSMLIVGSFISTLWIINPMMGFATLGLVFFVTPIVVKYLVSPWKKEKKPYFKEHTQALTRLLPN